MHETQTTENKQHQRQQLFERLKQNSQYFYIRFMGLEYTETTTKQKQKQKQKSSKDRQKQMAKSRSKQKLQMTATSRRVFDRTTHYCQLQFEMATKISNTSFKLNSDNKIDSRELEKLQDETHLFCYQGEEILNIKMKVTENLPKDKKKGTGTEGFSRVLVTPFIALPHTRHKVKVNLYEREENNKVNNKIVGLLNLEIFFLLKFKAELEIYPFYGNFQRSAPVIGQTRLACIFSMNGQKKKSIVEQEGGIHPKWHDYALSISQQSKKYSSSELFKPLEQNLMKFKLNSVGHYLKIDIVNFPLFDKDAQIVGTTQIRIENEDFLRLPNFPISCARKYNSKQDTNKLKLDINESSTKIISLRYMDPVTKVYGAAGTIVVGVRFIYDSDAIRRIVDSEEED